MLMKKRGPQGTDYLRRQLRLDGVSRVRASIFALTYPPPVSITPRMLLKFVHDKRGGVVAQAIDGLTHLKHRKSLRRIRSFYSSSNPYVVGAVLRHLSKLDPRAAKPLLFRALKHRKHIVRQNACDELDDLQCTEALPLLAPLLKDPHPDVRKAARWTIANLKDPGNLWRNPSHEESIRELKRSGRL